MRKIINLYAIIFARKFFYKFHKFLFHLSIRGLGILNYQNFKVSGEKYFLESIISKTHIKTVIDVGANVGDYSLRVKELKNDLNIYAFEPHPITYGILSKRTKKSGIKIFNFGFGDQDGMFQIHDYSEKDGSSHASLYKEVISEIHKGKAASHGVKIKKLDAFLQENNIEGVDLLKIDTEGNEYKVLLSAKKYLENGKIEIIHFEFNEMNVISRVFFRDFYSLLKDYQFFRILQDGLVPIGKYNPLFCEIYAFQNIVAIRCDLVEKFRELGIII